MEMQIPQLRQLFESRVGQISSVLATDPPAELGKIDPTMRGLKGFLFALEGMLRQNELQHMPFTARAELYKRVDQAIELLKKLPESLNGEQALGVLRVMDNLHRLCLQESLMASGLDASKLGRLTVILERKLGEVLDTIDQVAENGQGHAGKIIQATQERLAEIQGTYRREADALSSSASTALASIHSQAQTIQQQQADALETLKTLQTELRSKHQQWQTTLNGQLDTARAEVAKIQGERRTVTDLLARAREQLDSTKTAIQTIAETAETTASTRDELLAKLGEGRDIIQSIQELLESGTEAAGELRGKVTQAQQGLTLIQQTAEAGAAARETVAAAEKMLQESRQSLDTQLEAAAGTLAQIEVQQETVARIVERTRQQQQEAEQIAATAADNLRQGGEDLTQFHALLEKGRQDAEQLTQLAQSGDDLKNRVTQSLGQTQQHIEEIEGQATQAAAAIQEGKDQALHAVRDAMDEAERLQRQFAQTLSEQREAARDAVVALRGDQAIGADLLGRMQQDSETLAGQIARIEALRATAGDTEAQVRQKLERAGILMAKLKGILAACEEVKSQIDGHLGESKAVHERMDDLVRQTTAASKDLRLQQDQALHALREEAAAAEVQRKASDAALTEQLQTAATLVDDLRTHKDNAETLVTDIRQQRDAARAAQASVDEARLSTAQATGEVQATLQTSRRVATDMAGLLATGAETRAQIDVELAAATRAKDQANDICRQMEAFFAEARQQGKEMTATGDRVQQLLTDLRSQGQQTLDGLTRQNADLSARGEKLQRELKDLFGSGADSGLFRQFDELLQQHAPHQQQWLRRMTVGSIGGGASLAIVSGILALTSGWAAGAVLVAGLVPLGFFLYLCVSQYTTERRTESEHQYRAVLSRSLTAYRRLLASMQEEGIADSAYVDRMLSSLFGAPAPTASGQKASPAQATGKSASEAGQP